VYCVGISIHEYKYEWGDDDDDDCVLMDIEFQIELIKIDDLYLGEDIFLSYCLGRCNGS
jgi:hypothetical protein